jgi:hypothetical protein
MKLAQQNIRSKRNNIKPMFDMVAEQAELGSRAFFFTPKNNHAHHSVDPIADLVHNTIFLPVFRRLRFLMSF